MPQPITLNYHPRIQLSGMLRWMCPNCGMIQQQRMEIGMWELNCKNSRCTRQFAFGARLAVAKHRGKNRLPPADSIFPEAELVSWKHGTKLNEVVSDVESDTSEPIVSSTQSAEDSQEISDSSQADADPESNSEE